ncbi:2-hydroxy-3-oxopropionate reductase [Granulibacter bethesdensis]|uniref:NAD(P)-dependent oxidoreductase n=1 Tax=Granulibacter bethesdensis TaxID=364410 RepID=UPI00090B48FD|nr:NAD(P)-dependent oxidoreductase [Granulibacter bethesdensis]APH56778.1 2-hydroxy-3-oxopropionate reductase [Granulibacter bethesdensis]
MREALPMRIAVLGTGIMGRWMACRLADAGHEVTVWNRNPVRAAELGLPVAASAPDAARGADVALLMVSDGPACDAVLETGFIDTMAQNGIVLVMSSIEPWRARAQAKKVSPRFYVDAPVSGGEGGARDGTLAIMAGGEEAVLNRLAPVFAALGRMTRIGDIGTGQLAKLANQLIVGVTIGAVSEAFVLAEAGGASAARFREAVAGGFADSRILREHGQRMLDENFVPGGKSAIQLKDLRMILQEAKTLGLSLPMTEAVASLYRALCEAGDGDLDHAGLIRQIRRDSALPGTVQ